MPKLLVARLVVLALLALIAVFGKLERRASPPPTNADIAGLDSATSRR